MGGHVEPTISYEATAVKECKEETGVDINPNDLVFLKKMHLRTVDIDTGCINNTIGSQYAYLYTGELESLVIEKGKALGFEAWSIDTLFRLEDTDQNRFIPDFLSNEYLTLFREARAKLAV